MCGWRLGFKAHGPFDLIDASFEDAVTTGCRTALGTLVGVQPAAITIVAVTNAVRVRSMITG